MPKNNPNISVFSYRYIKAIRVLFAKLEALKHTAIIGVKPWCVI